MTESTLEKLVANNQKELTLFTKYLQKHPAPVKSIDLKPNPVFKSFVRLKSDHYTATLRKELAGKVNSLCLPDVVSRSQSPPNKKLKTTSKTATIKDLKPNAPLVLKKEDVIIEID